MIVHYHPSTNKFDFAINGRTHRSRGYRAMARVLRAYGIPSPRTTLCHAIVLGCIGVPLLIR